MTADELPDWLLDRVRREAPDDLRPFVVPGSTPVVCFGDQRVAEVATLGINPSWVEFCRPDATLFPDSERRLATLESVGAERLSDLGLAQVQQVLDGCYSYFDRNPYWRFFGYLEPVLGRLGYSFGQRTACHLDLVQWATNPVWSGIDVPTRQHLLDEDAPFLVNQMLWDRPEVGRLRLVLVNGRSAVEQCLTVGVPWARSRDLVVSGRSTQFWTADWKGVPMVGWSANVPHSFCSNAVREALPAHVAHLLEELGWQPGRSQEASPTADVVRVQRIAAEASGPVVVAVAKHAGSLIDALLAHEAVFDVDVQPAHVGLRAHSSAEHVVVLDHRGVRLALSPTEGERLSGLVSAEVVDQAPERWQALITEAQLADGQVYGHVVLFALRALAQSAEQDWDQPVAADELVEAIVEDIRWAGGVKDMADYWRTRRTVLMELLTAGIELPQGMRDSPRHTPEEDRAFLLRLVDDAARTMLHHLSPLATWIETPEVFLEIEGLQAHNEVFDDLTERRNERTRHFLLDVLDRAYPGISSRHTSTGELLARGVPALPPRDVMQLAVDGDWERLG